MKSYLTLMVIVFVSSTVLGQQKLYPAETGLRNNSIIRLNPTVSILSINTVRQLPINPHFLINDELAIGYHHFTFRTLGEENYITFPQQTTANLGKGFNLFEVGMGGTYVPVNRFGHSSYYYPMVGFRIQPQNATKFILRIFGSYPFLGKFIDGAQFVPLGMSVGFVVL